MLNAFLIVGMLIYVHDLSWWLLAITAVLSYFEFFIVTER